MPRRIVCLAVALACLLATAPAFAATRQPTGTTTPPVPAPPPLPAAWVLVDADSGAVVDAGNAHTSVPVASIFKVLTALVAVQHLRPGDPVPVSAHAAGMPARNINLKQGQPWRFDDLLHALLTVSANDAAGAIAEKVGGDLAGFDRLMAATAKRLGLADHPVLLDPAGLDDEFSYEGGNRISARDMAIVTRAALTYPQIATAVAEPVYRFDGGDGNPHRLLNHNLMLTSYPGAIGVKTGYTRRAGHSLIAAARRNGRTMIAVVIRAADPYRSAAGLLDRGFATPVAAEARLDHLPAVVLARAVVPVPSPATTPRRHTHVAARPVSSSSTTSALVPIVVLVFGGGPAIAILTLRRRRQRARVLRWSV